MWRTVATGTGLLATNHMMWRAVMLRAVLLATMHMMSRPVMLRAVLLAGIALPVGNGADAQRPQIDSLRDRALQSVAAVEPARAAERAAMAHVLPAPLDTVFADPLVVAMVPEMKKAGERGVRLAAEQIRTLLGDDSDLLRGNFIRIGTGNGAGAGGGHAATINVFPDANAAFISRTILTWVGPFLSAHGSPLLHSWATLPVGVDSTRLFRQAYAELATAAPGAATRCASGVFAECSPALGLIIPDDPVTVYWDSTGRYEAVRRRAPGWHTGANSRVGRRCITGYSDEACSEFLRSVMVSLPSWRARDLAPLGTAPRQALLLTAIRMGGAGAVGRLLADSADTPAEAIERAAGQPLENVLAEWRAGVAAARPTEHSRSRGRIATVLWSLAFAGMALGGTRWRAG